MSPAILIVLLATAFIALLINFPVYIEFCFGIDNDLKTTSKLNLSILRGKIKFKIPDFKKSFSKTKKEDKPQDNQNPQQSFLKKAGELKTISDRLLNVYNNSKKHIRKKLVVSNLDVYIKFGLFDACQTGIATGYIWAALYSVFAFVCENALVKNHNFNVEPYFQNSYLEAKANGIIKLTLVNIISVLLRIYFNYKKINKNREA